MAKRKNNEEPDIEWSDDEVESSFAEVWAPKVPGESVTGIYVKVEQIPAKNKPAGETFPSYRLKPMNGGKAVGVSGAMLSSKMDQVPVGTAVKITYLGLEKTGKGNAAKQFKVQVPRGIELLDPDDTTVPF